MREARFRDLVSEDFLVMYADSLTNLNVLKLSTSILIKKLSLETWF